MLKKHFLVLCCLLVISAGLWAESPVGLSEEFVQDPRVYLLQKIVRNKPIKYFIRATGERPGSSSKVGADVKLKQQVYMRAAVVRAVNSWFLHTKKEIEKSGRYETFKEDVWPVVSRQVALREVPSSSAADLVVWFTDLPTVHNECDDDSEGCFIDEKMLIIVPYLEYDKQPLSWSVQHTLTHEMGHALGLADQYENADNASVVYSTSHRISSPYKETQNISIMADSESLGCDDADAVVYALDYLANYQLPPEKYSARVRTGWASFCNDGTIFQDLKPLDKRPYVSKEQLYRYEKKGAIASQETVHPFLFKGKEINYLRENPSEEEGINLFAFISDLQAANDIVAILDTTDKQRPSLIMTVMDKSLPESGSLAHYKMERIASEDGEYWEFPYGTRARMRVYPRVDMCNELLTQYAEGVREFSWVNIGELPKPDLRMYFLRGYKDVSYTGPAFHPLTAHLDELGVSAFWEDNQWKCSVNDLQNSVDIITLTEEKRTASDEQAVARFAKKYNMTQAQFTQAAEQFCRESVTRLMAGLDVQEREELCGFVLELEDFYRQIVPPAPQGK